MQNPEPLWIFVFAQPDESAATQAESEAGRRRPAKIAAPRRTKIRRLPHRWDCRESSYGRIESDYRMFKATPAVASQASRSMREPESRAPGADSPLIRVEGLKKTYQTARGALHLFEGLCLEIEP